jgi:hypothetical protein
MFFVMESACAKKNSDGIEWKAGMAYKNGKAIYFDPDKLPSIEFFISLNYLTNQTKYYPLFPGGNLNWLSDDNILSYYSIPVTNYARIMLDSKKVLQYKISNDAIYLKDDNTDWEKMEFRLIKTHPSSDVFFLIYLKSRWFEGEYEIPTP